LSRNYKKEEAMSKFNNGDWIKREGGRLLVVRQSEPDKNGTIVAFDEDHDNYYLVAEKQYNHLSSNEDPPTVASSNWILTQNHEATKKRLDKMDGTLDNRHGDAIRSNDRLDNHNGRLTSLEDWAGRIKDA